MCVMCGMAGKEALKACQSCKDTNSDKERKKSGTETHFFHHMQGSGREGQRWLGGCDCKAEMGGLLISTMQYHAAGGSKARFGGNENGPSRRLMAHKDGAFRWDGRLNLDSGD